MHIFQVSVFYIIFYICQIIAKFGIWPPNFFEDLNRNSASTIRFFFYSKAIMKVSCKNIEKIAEK